MDNLSCKMQADARVCEENKLEEKTTPVEIMLWLKVQVWGSYRKSGETYQDDILKDNSPYA